MAGGEVVVAYDERGQSLVEGVRRAIRAAGYDIFEVNGSGVDDYPALALVACQHLLESGAHSGVLLCGTGVGMSIAANKVVGIRAACCTEPHSVERARRSNNANVLTLGGEVVNSGLAEMLVCIWLQHRFDSERSVEKVKALDHIE